MSDRVFDSLSLMNVHEVCTLNQQQQQQQEQKTTSDKKINDSNTNLQRNKQANGKIPNKQTSKRTNK